MKTVILALSLILVPALAAAQTATVPKLPAAAQSAAAGETKAVRVLLSAIHELPEREAFEKAAADPYRVIVGLAKGNGPIADRALQAMFLWPTEQTFAMAVSELMADATPTTRKHKLLMLLATNYGDQSTPMVAEFLMNDDVQLRITAAAAVAQIRTDAAFTALDVAIVVEENNTAKKLMQRYARRVVR